MKRALILTLLFVAGAGSGFYFDRWLHRPITVQITMHKCLAPTQQRL